MILRAVIGVALTVVIVVGVFTALAYIVNLIGSETK